MRVLFLTNNIFSKKIFQVGFLTAWHGLLDLAKLKEGDRVLVTGVRGAVGSAVAQVQSVALRVNMYVCVVCV